MPQKATDSVLLCALFTIVAPDRMARHDVNEAALLMYSNIPMLGSVRRKVWVLYCTGLF